MSGFTYSLVILQALVYLYDLFTEKLNLYDPSRYLQFSHYAWSTIVFIDCLLPNWSWRRNFLNGCSKYLCQKEEKRTLISYTKGGPKPPFFIPTHEKSKLREPYTVQPTSPFCTYSAHHNLFWLDNRQNGFFLSGCIPRKCIPFYWRICVGFTPVNRSHVCAYTSKPNHSQ